MSLCNYLRNANELDKIMPAIG